jgi:LDH2 family malate/lactate/ureidoglycolate dehydrogenase
MMARTEAMGIRTHGLARLQNYIDRIRAGGVNRDANPQIARLAPALLRVDGQDGLGAAVALRATRAAMEAARACGVGAAFCHRSSHQGAVAPQLYEAAQAGFAAIFATNTSPMIAPAGGRRPVIGNTPLGFAIPDVRGAPVILDMALSVVARSKVRRAAQTGAPIPETWATDAEGHPTTDAAAAMKGMMQAIGGAKGAHLALCLDLMAAGLSGAHMLSDVANANTDPGARADVGHFVVAIDTAFLMPPAALADRLDHARGLLRAAAPPDAPEAVRMPGARAVAALARAEAEGIDVAPEIAAMLTG